VTAKVLRCSLLLAGLTAPSLARAQVERLAGRVDEATRATVASVVDSARAAGVPAEPLVNKALEGASKGADGARIAAAVRALAADIGRARAALGPAATDPELVAGGAAVRAGVKPAFLQSLRGRYPRESLMVPLAVMADLVARGVPADTAAESVVALMREGVRDADLVAFRQNVERDIALGAPAGGAVAVRLTTATPGTTTITPGDNTPRPPRKP
jgi:hypothetical protein